MTRLCIETVNFMSLKVTKNVHCPDETYICIKIILL